MNSRSMGLNARGRAIIACATSSKPTNGAACSVRIYRMPDGSDILEVIQDSYEDNGAEKGGRTTEYNFHCLSTLQGERIAESVWTTDEMESRLSPLIA